MFAQEGSAEREAEAKFKRRITGGQIAGVYTHHTNTHTHTHTHNYSLTFTHSLTHSLSHTHTLTADAKFR